jgi:hypothetical protein
LNKEKVLKLPLEGDGHDLNSNLFFTMLGLRISDVQTIEVEIVYSLACKEASSHVRFCHMFVYNG